MSGKHGRMREKKNQNLKNTSTNIWTKCRVLLKISREFLEQYIRRHPQELRDKDLFHLAIIENPPKNVRYKKQRLGENTIDCMMKSVFKEHTSLKNKKKLTKHTSRKIFAKKLRTASVEKQSIT